MGDGESKIELHVSSTVSGDHGLPLLEEEAAAVDPLQTNASEVLHDELEQGIDLSRNFRMANCCFFVGSILYLGVSVWNVIDAYRYYGEHYDDDDEENEQFWTGYRLLSSTAAIMYVANSLIDGRVAIFEIRGKRESIRFGEDPRWEIGAAVTFGVAALFDFLSALIWNDNDMWPGYFTGSAAVDIYLLNAVLVITGRKPNFTTLPESFMSAGDILFLIGSAIDVIISFVDNPKAPSSRSILIAWLSFASSALWFLDALLYICADYFDDDYSSVSLGESASIGDYIQDEFEISSLASPWSPADLSFTDERRIEDTALQHRHITNSPYKNAGRNKYFSMNDICE